jgi:anti-sigma B factor antagonist
VTFQDFQIHETEQDGWRRLQVTGELDLASAPSLQERLNQLRAEKRLVRLDLSQLEFIDSTGIHLLIRAIIDSRQDSWQLEVERDLSPQVERVLKLAHVDKLILADSANNC